MSPLPYLPGGSTSTPAERYVVYSDSAHDTMLIDESISTADGQTMTGYWTTPTLNRPNTGAKYWINRFRFRYTAAAATTVTVRVSGDGGNTWAETETVTIDQCTNEARRASVAFNTSGTDIRVQIRFDTSNLVKIHQYRANLIPLGDLDYD